jgi:hypothetical protein
MLASSTVQAQQGATTGTIRGRVTSGTQAVANAQVTARNTATGVQRGALADAEGRFVIPLLAPGGPYVVQVTSLGFSSSERTLANVGAGDVVTVNFDLTVQAVELQGLTVGAGEARIDVTQGGVVQRVNTEQIENLPVNGRDFTDFLKLSPLVSPQPQVGTGGQFAIGGARTSGTNVQIDGADANNIYFGENRGSSRIPFAFSLESIKEFQLITNGFDVEYGNYQGGIVNVVTRTGTNEFTANGFYYRRDQRLTANSFLGVEPTDYHVNQFGLALGGPIKRDVAHFFLSADGQIKRTPILATTPASAVIDPAAQQRIITALQDVYGVDNASSYFGEFKQSEDNIVLFGRVDWNVNNSHRLTLRQNYSNFEQKNDRVSTTDAVTSGGPFKDKVFSTVAEMNSVLGGSAFNTLRLQFSYEDRPRDANENGGYLPQFNIRGVPGPQGNRTVNFGGDGIIFRNRLEETKLQLVDNFTVRSGQHTFKLGTNNILSNTLNEFWLLGNGEWRFTTIADFEANRPAQYSRFTRRCPVALVTNAAGERVVCPEPDVPIAEFNYLEWSLYGQDDFQLTDRLLITGGLRVGGTTFRDNPAATPALDQAFNVQSDEMPDFTGISPRLSFTYDVSGNQDQLLRGGVGLLVGRAPTVIAGNAISTERPLLSITCTGTDIPTINFDDLLSADRGENNPAACRSGADPTGRPEYTVFATDFKLPKTLKANLGYEHLLRGSGTKLGIDLLYSETKNNFWVQDLNLRDADLNAPGLQPQFRLDEEKATPETAGRPVFVPRTGTGAYNPLFTAGSSRLRNAAFDRVYMNVSDAESRSYAISLEVDQRLGEQLTAGLRYAYNPSYDNSSFSCCTSNEGFTNSETAGDPNFIGDPGDEAVGTWGPTRFERRHTFVANVLWRAPLGLRVSGILRSQAGVPFTPLVDGDLNGDGIENDRPFLSTDLQFDADSSRTIFNEIVSEHSCIREQLNTIATRNSCRNPWWHSLDIRVSKEITTVRGQRAEILVDFFNVLNGLNHDWGRFMAVFGSAQNVLIARRYDLTTSRVVYGANRGFGTTGPSGFEPFQFQAQLGVRYRF